MNGGYINIDCGGLNLLAESAQTITGLYQTVFDAWKRGKPMYAYNCMWGETLISPIAVFAIPFPDSNEIICTASTLQVVIKNDDTVTINNLAPSRAKK